MGMRIVAFDFTCSLIQKEITPPFLYIAANGGYQCIFRDCVSRTAAGKGRAVLEGLGLPPEVIDACFVNNRGDVEAAIQAGLLRWSEGGGCTWNALLRAMIYARIGYRHCVGLRDKIIGH